jgi:hypothetical protein
MRITTALYSLLITLHYIQYRLGYLVVDWRNKRITLIYNPPDLRF